VGAHDPVGPIVALLVLPAWRPTTGQAARHAGLLRVGCRHLRPPIHRWAPAVWWPYGPASGSASAPRRIQGLQIPYLGL